MKDDHFFTVGEGNFTMLTAHHICKTLDRSGRCGGESQGNAHVSSRLGNRPSPRAGSIHSDYKKMEHAESRYADK